MTKYECMDCGNVFDSDESEDTARCPLCNAHPFYIKKYNTNPTLKEYQERHMSLLKEAFPDMTEEQDAMLRQIFCK